MRYRNKKTGAVIETKSTMGGNWEPIKAPAAPAEKPAPRKKGTAKK